MEMKTCEKCRKFFNAVRDEKMCPACTEELEKTFQGVKDYIREHPGAPISAVCEECDVTEKQIKKWIKEERLILTEGSPVELTCEKCGAPIHTGRYCEKCKGELAKGLSGAIEPVAAPEAPKPKKPEGGAKMRFIKN